MSHSEITKDDVLRLYGKKALQTLFISSSKELMDQYVLYLKGASRDLELDYLHQYIESELKEFEVTSDDVHNYSTSLWNNLESVY